MLIKAPSSNALGNHSSVPSPAFRKSPPNASGEPALARLFSVARTAFMRCFVWVFGIKEEEAEDFVDLLIHHPRAWNKMVARRLMP